MGDDGFYDAYVLAKIRKEALESPTNINCGLAIPKTDYYKKKTTIFIGKSN